MLPHFRVLSSFLNEILRDSDRVLDINCHSGSLFEAIKVLYPYNVEYIGIDKDVDNIEEALVKNLLAKFRCIDYDKMKLRTDSYDLIIVQDQFLNCSDPIKKLDALFRASRKNIIFFNFLVVPEYDGYVEIEINGKKECIYGVSHMVDLLTMMEPSSFEYSFITKTDNPSAPTPSIFVVRV